MCKSSLRQGSCYLSCMALEPRMVCTFLKGCKKKYGNPTLCLICLKYLLFSPLWKKCADSCCSAGSTRKYYPSYFTDGKAENQRGERTCPRSHRTGVLIQLAKCLLSCILAGLGELPKSIKSTLALEELTA